MEERATSALMTFYLRRVIAKMVVPKPVRAKRAQKRSGSR